MSWDKINNALKHFTTISLKEMDAVKLMNRVETKFIFTLKELPELLSSIEEFYKVVKIEDKTILSYESFYFDDKDHFFYNEHLRGRQDRYKVRYRRYVDSNLTFFEVKHKRKGRTRKTRIKTIAHQTELGTEEQSLLKELSVPKTDLIPSISNSYIRISLVNKTSVERLTLDIDLRFEHKDTKNELSDLVIAELKQERITRSSPFYLAAKRLHLRPFRLSKYCTGLVQMKELNGLRFNRFKKKLLHINKLSNYGVNLV